MGTWTLQDIGYDANQRDNPVYDVTDETMMDAIRHMDGFRNAIHAEPISQQSSILVVYAKAPEHTGADWTKIGCIYDRTPGPVLSRTQAMSS